MEKDSLVGVLNLGRELAEQLKKQIDSHDQPCESLIQKIVSSYDKAIAMLNYVGNSPADQLRRDDSSSGSSRKRVALAHDPDILIADSKRKKMQKWSRQVRASDGTEVLDDGFSWRKYGQKDILGANFPRAYYRCTHRHVQGCLATKQVQRSNEDLSIFEITYKGTHTCIQSNASRKLGVAEIPSMANSEKEEVYLVECGSSSFVFPENFESNLFSSFETEQLLEGFDCDMGKVFDWSGFDRVDLDANFSLDILELFDVIQNPLWCES